MQQRKQYKITADNIEEAAQWAHGTLVGVKTIRVLTNKGPEHVKIGDTIKKDDKGNITVKRG